jgi:trimeric autotransporter adhesin
MKNLFLIIMFFVGSTAHGQYITTIAGNDTSGFSGDGGPAQAAKLSNPTSAWPDTHGNLYISDGLNGRIRKVSAAGIITSIAGNGTHTFSGDGGPALMAGIYLASSVEADTAGNIYIGEQPPSGNPYGARVRKISHGIDDTTFIITTIAGGGCPGYCGDGGPATAAGLENVCAIAIDKAGNVYTVDNVNNRIRKVNSAGVITTMGGTGTAGYSGDSGPATAAQFSGPVGVAVDYSGNIYISDGYNNRIRKVNTAGMITTIAGTGAAGFSGDGGQATAAQIHFPIGIAVDATGNIYFVDSRNLRIREINTAGIITTIAGNGTLGNSGDGGPATAAEFATPSGVSVDGAGNVYISDGSAHIVRKIYAHTTGITPSDLSEGTELLRVFPNPNDGAFTVRVSSGVNVPVQITVTNILGQKIKEITAATNKDIPLQLRVPNGMYFVNVVTEKRRWCEKVLVE